DNYIESWDWKIYKYEDGEKIFYNNPEQSRPNVSLDDPSIYDVELTIESSHGCSDSLYRDSVVIVDDLNLTIEDVDTVVCFNGESLIDKHYRIDFESLFETELNVLNYEWRIEPEVNLVQQKSESEIHIRFTESNTYQLTFELSIDNGGNPCTYTTQKEFQIGVNAEIDVPDALCVGGESSIMAEVSVGVSDTSYYSWFSESNLIIGNSSDLNTSILTIDSLPAGTVESYPLTFKVVNDVGCWKEVDTMINVYQVDAEFDATLTGEICAYKSVSLKSLYTDSITSFKWSSPGVNYLGELTVDRIAEKNTPDVNFLYTEMGVYDVSLEVISKHGCVDFVGKEQLYDVKRPYPKFTFEERYGCDGTSIKIIDESEYSSDIILQYENFNSGNKSIEVKNQDSTMYKLNETNEIEFFFPYSETKDLSYNYDVILNAMLGECPMNYVDSVTIYPNPVLDITASDLIGCPPFEVSFENNSSYFDENLSNYLWHYGNGVIDEDFTTNYTYNKVGDYEVYHKTVSENGCSSDTILSDTIKVFPNPTASFDYVTSDLCFNASYVDFFDNSIFETDSIFTEWVFQSDTTSVPYRESHRINFNSEEGYDVGLIVTDLRGCSDDTLQTINIEILDNKITPPEIEYVTVNSSGVVIYWKESSIDSNFETMEIYHRSSEDEWSNIDSVKNITNNYFHNAVEQYTVNDYCLLQYDSCGIISDTSIVHSTIFLETQSTDYQTMDLSWTPYVGWEEVSRYDIFRSDDQLNYKLVDEVPGDMTFYKDTNLCNISYTHYVVAHHPNGVYKSNSNISILKEPLFIDFTQPLDLVRTTVVNDQYLTTEWDEFYTHEMTYYNIHRWDEYFGWISDYYSPVRDSLFVDPSANPKGRKYKYRASYADECGNEGPNSGIGANILLKGVQFPEHYYLHWNAYEDWMEGVGNYTLQYYNSDDSSYVNLKTLSNSMLEYTDQDLVKNGIDTSYCYRVVAQSMSNNYSISNDFCFVPSPKKYFPNAFTPDGDGVNDHYSYSGLFGKAIEVNIYDRWGSLVFTSTDIDFVWDGTYNNSGKYCPMGTYIMEFELIGFDGIVIRDQTSIVLYR
ncbi:gliding motility-associated C-terminal domain-containing protein, partial [Flavobacteriales bacterium]|nr:gliding motility-associated C-terminal domain-containing protein [Flavobacteriales bacterium]